MPGTFSRSALSRLSSRLLNVVLCTAVAAQLAVWPLDAAQQPTTPASQQPAAKIPADQLDSLVAPIALYPDPMLAQVLAASTYPLEIMQLQQWLQKNPGLKDKALADAVMKLPWDPSVQAMAGLPDIVKRLADDIQWTADLGNAFLAQQSDVMDAVQRMRKKAQDKGTLKSSEQVKVETQVIETKQVVVIEQTNPQVVYVPSYNPVVVWGPPVYPYLSVSADLLSTAKLLRRGRRGCVGRRVCHGRVLGRRRMGLPRGMGRQRHRHRRQQQLQSQFEPEHEHQRRTKPGEPESRRRGQHVAAQSAASRRHALRRSIDCEQIRRQRPR